MLRVCPIANVQLHEVAYLTCQHIIIEQRLVGRSDRQHWLRDSLLLFVWLPKPVAIIIFARDAAVLAAKCLGIALVLRTVGRHMALYAFIVAKAAILESGVIASVT